MPVPSLSTSSSSSATNGPLSSSSGNPWYQGDIVLNTGGSTGTSGDRTAPALTAGDPLATVATSTGLSSGTLIIAGFLIVGAVLWKSYR